MGNKKPKENQNNEDYIMIPNEKFVEIGKAITLLVVEMIAENAIGNDGAETKRGRGRPKKNVDIEEKLDQPAKKKISVRVRG